MNQPDSITILKSDVLRLTGNSQSNPTLFKFFQDLFQKMHMLDCNPCLTPCHPNQKLLNHGSAPVSDPSTYRSIVGALQHLTFTRPDISFSVNQVCQFMHSPLDTHFDVVKRILRYLRGTMHLGLSFKSGFSQLKAYIDAD